MKKILLCFVLATATVSPSFAQSLSQMNRKDYTHWSFAIGNSLTYYRVQPFTRAMNKGFWHYYLDEMGGLLNPSFSLEYTINPLFGIGLHAGYYDYTRQAGTLEAPPSIKPNGYYYEGHTLDVTFYLSGNIANMLWPCRTGFASKLNAYGDIGVGAGWYQGFWPKMGEVLHGQAYVVEGKYGTVGKNKGANGWKYGGYSPVFSFQLTPEWNFASNFALGLGFGYRIYTNDALGGWKSSNRGQVPGSVEPMNNDGWNITLGLRFKLAGKKKQSIRDVVLCDYAAAQEANDKKNQLSPELLKRIDDAEKNSNEIARKTDGLDEAISDQKRAAEKALKEPESTTTNGYAWQKDKGTKKNPWTIKGVNFVFDQTKLIDRSNPDLKAVLVILIAHYDEWNELKIDGHTDSFGTEAYNYELGMRRAEAIRDFLVANGLGDKKFTLESFGKSKPIVPNTTPDGKDDPEGRQENRRVELYIIK